MIDKLIRLANNLDESGRKKQADYIDGIITHVHGKDMPGPVELDAGDFSNLDETNITHDEAFSAGCSVCGDKSSSCDHKESSYMVKPQLYKIYDISD